MRQNCPSYRIGDRDDFSDWSNQHTYTMIFTDDCSHHASYVQYDVEIRKLVYRGELRDCALLKSKRFTVDRGTRLALIVEVLANLSGNKEILERLAHELFWTQELSLDKEPGLYAEYFPEEYERLIKSQLFHRNKQVEEVMNE
jgi:hypothetical protein